MTTREPQNYWGSTSPRTFTDSAESCPKCGANLQGAPIPKERQADYGATHYSRKIGVTDPVADRTVEWLCPDCGHRWPR